jgi:CRISPR-associated protein Csx10
MREENDIVRFTLGVTMLTDWHVGTGGGRHGAIDRLIERDEEGLPFLPATTVRGIWRDAAERLALGLDDGVPSGLWAKVVEGLFGDEPALADHRGVPVDRTPQGGVLSLSAARLSDHLRLCLRDLVPDRIDAGRARLRQALSFVKPGVAIDATTGAAREDHLRFEEVARQGAVLRAQGEIQLAGAQEVDKARVALLMAATRLIERLGGKRRRGAGRGTWTIAIDPDASVPFDTADAAIDWLKGHAKPSLECAAPAAEEVKFGAAADADHDWDVLPLILELLAPVVIADNVLGNVVTSRDSVPGTFLLPHVARALARAGMMEVWRHIAAGDVRVSTATAEIAGTRGLPMPMAWWRQKDDDRGPDGKGTVVNCLSEGRPRDRSTSFKPMRGGYVADVDPPGIGGAPPKLRERVDTVVRTHNTVEDEVQRPTEAVGGVYSYEALKPGARLGAQVRVRTSLAGGLQWKARVARGVVRIGRAAKAGYGEIALRDGSPQGRPQRQPPDLRQDDGSARSAFSIWLTSDALLRPHALGPGTTTQALVDAVRDTLRRLLNKDVSVRISDADAHLRSRRTESWASQWSLPRPSLIALQAGSCAVVDGLILSDAEAADLENEGIGERRAEGYGEIRVNHPLLAARTSEWHPPEGTSTKSNQQGDRTPSLDRSLLDQRELDFVTAIEDAAWRSAVVDAAFRFAANRARRRSGLGWKTGGDQGSPPMSQLGALRTAMNDLAEPDDVEATKSWVKAIGTNKNRAEKWGGALALLNGTSGLLSQAGRVWTLLEGGDREDADARSSDLWPAPLLRPVEEMKRAFWREAVRALILASMRAHKRDLESGRNRDAAIEPESEEAA